jgi:hypothetical protein
MDDAGTNEKAINLSRQPKKNWDYVGSNNFALSKAMGTTTQDCAELSKNDQCRNVLLGSLANHKHPPSTEEVLMDHFKSPPSGMIVLDNEDNLTALFSAHLSTSSDRDQKTTGKSEDKKGRTTPPQCGT